MRFDQIQIGHHGLSFNGTEFRVCAIDEDDQTIMDENGTWLLFSDCDFPELRLVSAGQPIKAILWQQNGPTEQGLCLIEIGDRISVELTGSATNEVTDAEVQRTAEIIMAAPVLAKLLARIEPYLGAIICYASTTDEHEPNALAADVSGWLGHLRDCGAIANPAGVA